jgi:hypothetical protein
MRLSPAFLVALAVALALAGCADASGRFQAFEDRRGALDGQGGTASVAGATGSSGSAGELGCVPPAPDVVSGLALLALETSMTPGIAMLFLGQIETPELDGATSVKYSYRALDATDRQTQVGEPLVVGPYPIGEDGSFNAPTGKSTLAGRANPILPGVEIVSDLTLHGTICGVDTFYCGTVTGTVYSPLAGPATGRFGLTLLESAADLPARPRFGCGEKALAPALPD